jgi:signal transduction histidine kinase
MEREFLLPVRGQLERRHIVLATAGLLTIAIFVLRQISGDVANGVTALYVIPVALVALELGLNAGIGAALLAFALVILWTETSNVSLDAGELAVRLAAFIAVAVVCGRFADRMRGARAHQQQLLASGLALAESTDRRALPELVARVATELVPARGARVTIESLPPATTGSLDGDLFRLMVRAGGAECGLIEIAPPLGRPLSADEQAALELLTVQVAVAAEHHRMTALQLDRARLHAELSEAHGQLADQERRLELLLSTQELERQSIARELHDQAAQTLAAIQLGLSAVERDLGSEPTRAQVEVLRTHLGDTLRTLRELAVDLRPPALDQLGLDPALRGLAERAQKRSGHVVEVDGLSVRLTPHLETTVYRVVDDLVGPLSEPARVHVDVSRAGPELRIVATALDGTGTAFPSPVLAERIGARLELVGGFLAAATANAGRLVAELPVLDPYADGDDAPGAAAEATSSSASR